MKEISEEWQMKIFDLLEGNLSGEEKALVEQAIAADAALQREYNLMAKTYLEPEPAVFLQKDTLYRKNNGFFVISARWYAAAASVALMIGGVAIYQTYLKRNAEPLASVAGSDKSNKPVQVMPGPVRPADKDSGKMLRKPFTAVQQEAVVMASLPAITAPKKDTAGNDGRRVGLTPRQKVAADELKGVGIRMAQIEADALSESFPSEIVIIDQYTQPLSYKKKKNLSYKLLNNSRQMIANLRLPDVHFRTGKGKNRYLPSLKVEIKTPETQVIATLIE